MGVVISKADTGPRISTGQRYPLFLRPVPLGPRTHRSTALRAVRPAGTPSRKTSPINSPVTGGPERYASPASASPWRSRVRTGVGRRPVPALQHGDRDAGRDLGLAGGAESAPPIQGRARDGWRFRCRPRSGRPVRRHPGCQAVWWRCPGGARGDGQPAGRYPRCRRAAGSRTPPRPGRPRRTHRGTPRRSRAVPEAFRGAPGCRRIRRAGSRTGSCCRHA
jgi:hypothetical protein